MAVDRRVTLYDSHAPLPRRSHRGPWMLGERFSAAGVLWGTALRWTTVFKLVPESPLFADYIARVAARSAAVRGLAKDAELGSAAG